eukprot:CFRG6620T1
MTSSDTTKNCELDVVLARLDTPGCFTQVSLEDDSTEKENKVNLLHFNGAGSALPLKQVAERINRHIQLETEIGGYEAAEVCAKESALVYEHIAQLVNARDVGEIACAENATRAFDYVFYSLNNRNNYIDHNGKRTPRLTQESILITTAPEYGSNYISLLQIAKETGAQVVTVESEKSGVVSLTHLEQLFRYHGDKVAVLSLCWIPTNGGLIQPAEQVGALCEQYNVPFILDACQALGHIVVDVQRIKCDALVGTGRKYLRGPRGTGVLYVREGSVFAQAEPVFLDIHSASLSTEQCEDGIHYKDCYTIDARPARRYENWERPVALWLGLGVATKYALEIGIPLIEKRIRMLGRSLRDKLRAINTIARENPVVQPKLDGGDFGVHVECLGDSQEQCGIVSFRVIGMSASEVKKDLYRLHGIRISVSPLSSTFMDMRDRGLAAVARASVHYYNSEDEIERFVEAVSQLATTASARGFETHDQVGEKDIAT